MVRRYVHIYWDEPYAMAWLSVSIRQENEANILDGHGTRLNPISCLYIKNKCNLVSVLWPPYEVNSQVSDANSQNDKT